MEKNTMLTGKPAKTLLLFSLPILAGNLLQQLYSIIDSLVVGNFVSSDALAAVGNTIPIVFMITCVSFGISNGASILIGQYFGSGKSKDLKRLISTSTFYILAVSAVLAVAALLSSRWLLSIMNTPANVFEDSLIYIRIYFLGLMFVFGFNMISAIFRSLGDSKTPLLFLGVASVANILLDLLFVLVFGWGVMGVAVATVMAQCIAFLLQILLLMKKIKPMEGELGAGIRGKVDARALRQLTRLAIPTTSQELLVSVGIIITQALINTFGANVMAAFTAGDKIVNFAMMPMINMCIALTVFSAQNVGASKPKRVVSGYKAALCFGLVVATVMSAIAVFFGQGLIGLFLGKDPNGEILAAGNSYLLYSVFAFYMMALLFAAEGVMKGAGDVNFFTFSAVTGAVVKAVASVCLMPTMGYAGVWMGINIGWLAEAILTTARCLSGKWKNKCVVENNGEEKSGDAD